MDRPIDGGHIAEFRYSVSVNSKTRVLFHSLSMDDYERWTDYEFRLEA